MAISLMSNSDGSFDFINNNKIVLLHIPATSVSTNRQVATIGDLQSVTQGLPQNSQTFTSSGVFTVPAGVTSILVTGCGGGGGGGGAGGPVGTDTSGGDGGGSSGGFTRVFSVTPSLQIPIVIGAGGAGGAGTTVTTTTSGNTIGGNGGNGGDTVLTNIITLYGGGGGTGAFAIPNLNGSGGTCGGAGGTYHTAIGGSGAGGMEGRGGTRGGAGLGYGSGASGATGGISAGSNSYTYNTGGYGAPGKVIISW